MAEYRQSITMLIGTAWRVDRMRTLAALLEPLGNVLALLSGLWLATLTTGVLHRDGRLVAAGIAGIAVGVALGWQLDLSASQWRLVLSDKVAQAFDAEIAATCSTLPGLEHHDNAEYRDKLELLRQGQGMLGRSLNALAMAVKAVCGGLTVFVLLVLVHPMLLVLVVLALPAVWLARHERRWRERAETASATPGRLARHLRTLSYDRDAGMEIRIFGLTEEIADRAGAAWRAYREPLCRAELRIALVNAARDSGYILGMIGAVGFVLWRLRTGHASAGDVVLAIYLSQQVQTAVLWPVISVGGLGQTLRAADRMRWLRAYAARAKRSGDRPAPRRIGDGIVFQDVSFRYPGSDNWVLRHVNLTIPAGSVLALVGENGAGKSTLVQLLCRLYAPTEGRILIDGIDLAEFDLADWRRQLSAAFQDFARLEFTAQRTVGVGELTSLDDRERVDRALGRAGADAVRQALPAGLDTQLGTRWAGADLSTGQWQMLALGRALMRDDPLLVFFDEPTAALDATTEHALFERYAAVARSGGGRGMITVLVSHRFSTVRSADRIVVLADSRIQECGSHAELMANDQLYAELYSMQARSYQLAAATSPHPLVVS